MKRKSKILACLERDTGWCKVLEAYLKVASEILMGNNSTINRCWR